MLYYTLIAHVKRIANQLSHKAWCYGASGKRAPARFTMRHTALLLVAALLCWLVDARTEADKAAYSSGQVVDDALADQGTS